MVGESHHIASHPQSQPTKYTLVHLPSPPPFLSLHQDLRLYTVSSVEDATVCNDEKLASGSTAAYLSAAELFLKDTVFRENEPWPNVIWAPSNMVDSDEAPNLQISVSGGCRVSWRLLSADILLQQVFD